MEVQKKSETVSKFFKSVQSTHKNGERLLGVPLTAKEITEILSRWNPPSTAGRN
jgi:phenylalanyl-tRNA synthetase beta subunit